MATITGTPGPDHLTGTPAADRINGLGGDDTIAGGRGADLIDAGGGDDLVTWRTGDGDDRIDGGTGFDTTRIDTSAIAAGADYRLAAAGQEVLVSWPGGQHAALDLSGIERLELTGGRGDSEVRIGDLGATDLDRSGGSVVLTLGRNGHGTEQVDGHAADVPLHLDAEVSARSELTGGSRGDVLVGAFNGPDRLIGGGGGDLLSAGAGENRLFGGNGDDHFLLLAGANKVTTGPGADLLTMGTNPERFIRSEVTDFDPMHDHVAFESGTTSPVSALDTNHDGRVDAADTTVQDALKGMTVELSVLTFEGTLDRLTFDHLHSLPLDVFVG